MDFIERLFGLSPDGGSGLLELFIVLAVAILLTLGVRARRWRFTRSDVGQTQEVRVE